MECLGPLYLMLDDGFIRGRIDQRSFYDVCSLIRVSLDGTLLVSEYDASAIPTIDAGLTGGEILTIRRDHEPPRRLFFSCY